MKRKKKPHMDRSLIRRLQICSKTYIMNLDRLPGYGFPIIGDAFCWREIETTRVINDSMRRHLVKRFNHVGKE